jgi:hypothetical protein
LAAGAVRDRIDPSRAALIAYDVCRGGDAAAHACSLDTSMKMYARVRSLEQTVAMLVS